MREAVAPTKTRATEGSARVPPSCGEWLRTYGHQLGLRVIESTVDPMQFQATAYLEHLEHEVADPPPVLFSSPTALAGGRSDFRLLFNAFAALRSLNLVLGAAASSWPGLLDDFVRRVSEVARPQITEEPAPVHTNIVKGESLDLAVLPWVRHVAHDGGPYFTPIVVACDSISGRYNLSWNRAMYLDRNHLAIHISPRHLWSCQRAAEERDEALPVALVLGHHPAFNLAAAALTTTEDDEYEAATSLLGGELRLSASVSFGADLLVPSDAEVVIEGRLLPRQRTVEGPFGEYLLYLGPQKLSHVVEVDALTYRDAPVVVEIFASHRDHLNAHIAIEASIFHKVRTTIPQVTAVSWFRGGGPTTLVLSINKSSEGQPMRAALAAMAASNIVKQVIVVDDDVDIEDSHEVLWAVSTRVSAEEDITVLKNLQRNLLDPSQAGSRTTSGLIIDATVPLSADFPPVARVPRDALDRFPMESFDVRTP